MFKQKHEFSAIFLGVMLSCVGVAQSSDSFTSSKFLTYKKSTQETYISTAAGMAGVIATQNKPSQATCIDNWIARYRESGYQPVIETMHKYPNYHPQGVIIAVLQKACGTFRYLK